MPKGLQPRESLTWTIPRLCNPGDVVLVHALWTPHPDCQQQWLAPPEPPGDEILGFWAPVPRHDLAVEDFHYAHCCAMVEGVVNLFQEDPDFCVIMTLGTEWRFPWEGERFIAVMTPELQQALNDLLAAPKP